MHACAPPSPLVPCASAAATSLSISSFKKATVEGRVRKRNRRISYRSLWPGAQAPTQPARHTGLPRPVLWRVYRRADGWSDVVVPVYAAPGADVCRSTCVYGASGGDECRGVRVYVFGNIAAAGAGDRGDTPYATAGPRLDGGRRA